MYLVVSPIGKYLQLKYGEKNTRKIHKYFYMFRFLLMCKASEGTAANVNLLPDS